MVIIDVASKSLWQHPWIDVPLAYLLLLIRGPQCRKYKFCPYKKRRRPFIVPYKDLSVNRTLLIRLLVFLLLEQKDDCPTLQLKNENKFVVVVQRVVCKGFMIYEHVKLQTGLTTFFIHWGSVIPRPEEILVYVRVLTLQKSYYGCVLEHEAAPVAYLILQSQSSQCLKDSMFVTP